MKVADPNEGVRNVLSCRKWKIHLRRTVNLLAWSCHLVIWILLSWTWGDINSSWNVLVLFPERSCSALQCPVASRREWSRYDVVRQSLWAQEYHKYPRAATCLQFQPAGWYTKAYIDMWIPVHIVTLIINLNLDLKIILNLILKLTYDPGKMLHESSRSHSKTVKGQNRLKSKECKLENVKVERRQKKKMLRKKTGKFNRFA